MRHLLLSLVALGAIAGVGASHANAQPVVLAMSPAAVQTVQYYEPSWREREEWRRRREIEFRRREEIRRHEEWREFHRPPPPGYLPPRY